MSARRTNSTGRLQTALATLLALAFVVSIVLTVVSLCVRASYAPHVELARVALENVSRRVSQSSRILAAVRGRAGSERLDEVTRLADIGEIARTTRVGHGGAVSIVPVAACTNEPLRAFRVVTEGASTRVSFAMETEGYRISVSVPVAHPTLAARDTIDMLTVLDVLLLVILLAALPTVRARIVAQAVEIHSLFFGNGGGLRGFFRMFATPLAIGTILGFAVLLVVLHVGGSRIARRNAELRLRAAAEDIVDELDACVGRQLGYIGQLICDRYRSPERMKGVDLKTVMEVYGLDELNVVDGKGVVVASNLPIVGDDQWRKTNPRKFNTALLKERRDLFAQCFRESADEPGVWYKYVGVAFPPPAEGYLQLGFCRSRMQHSFDYTMRELVTAWHIGERGFYVISRTSNGEILSTMDATLAGKTYGDVGFNILRARENSNVDRRDPVSNDFLGFAKINFFESNFNGETCLCTSGVVNQFHRYVAAIPHSEIYGPVRRALLFVGLILFAALLVADAVILRQMKLVTQLKSFMAAERDRQLKDLTLARTIQTSALPVVFPDEPDYKIFARMDTAREVGGDFYDFYKLPTGEVVFLIADVSGKGVPAALFMMRAKALLRSAVFAHPDDLAAAVALANDLLSEKNDAEMFVTAWIGVLDRRTRVVTFVNAGHNPPLVKRADGSVEWLRARGGLVLAATGGVRYRTATATLAPGDSLFLYTDGVTEAMNKAQQQYGEARLEKALRANADGLFVTAVRADVTAFVAGAEPSDDITMLALDVKPRAPGSPASREAAGKM